MKKTIFILLCLFAYINSNAQTVIATPEQIKAYENTKLCIVYDDNIFNAYNNEIEAAVKQNWTQSEYEFIKMSEFKKRRKDPNYSFLIKTKVIFESDRDLTAYTFLSLLLGGRYNSVDDMPTLCSFPLSYYDVDYDKYIYKLGALVLFVQNHMELVMEKPELADKNIVQYYNKNVEEIDNKTLYVLKDELAPEVNTISKIKKIYDGDVKIVEQSEIHKKIKNKNSDALFLHKVGPPKGGNKARCFKLIMGAADGKLYYTNYHKIKTGKRPDGLLKKDFKKLNRR